MSDTWQDLQAFKSKQASIKERLARRKKERQEVVAGILASDKTDPPKSPAVPAQNVPSSMGSPPGSVKQEVKSEVVKQEPEEEAKPEIKLTVEELSELEAQLLLALDDATLEVPCSAVQLVKVVSKSIEGLKFPITAVEDLLQKFSAQALIVLKDDTKKYHDMTIASVDHNKIAAVTETLHIKGQSEKKRKRDEKDDEKDIEKAIAKHPKREDLQKKDDLIESLLSASSAKEKENQKLNDEILELLSKPTAKEMSLVEKFRSQKGAAAVQEFCPHGTKEECRKVTGQKTCDKLHFKKILHKHTDESLGDCSFLNTCYHMDSCKYVHYEVDYPEVSQKPEVDRSLKLHSSTAENITLTPPQWVQCDMRFFEFSILGKFSVIMADPPWDIHMELPYGTMSDDEMRNLPIPHIQNEGFIFLWVTGRAMELGRECLQLWGYDRVDELIWVKTNQLQRIIRTGRTGHWLNHGKEHCLIGVKGNPQGINRGLDCDVIVAEVRATSHKPDEVYGMIERLSPGTRKIELFGRPHNVQPNWITLGNQVDGVKLLDPQVVNAFREKYPDPKMAMLPPDKAKKYYETGRID